MALKLLLVTAALAPAHAQLLRGSFHSSWFASSSVWTPGSDGRMHQQVHEVRSETIQQSGMPTQHTQSEVACKDGRCQQTVSIMQAAPAPRLGLFGILVSPSLRTPLLGHGALMASRLAGSAPVRVAAPPQPQLARPASGPAANVDPLAGLAASFAAVAVGVFGSAAAVAALAKCHRGASARERPLQSLGEPLAPAQEAACRPAKAPAAGPKQAAGAVAAAGTAAAQAAKELLPHVYAAASVAASKLEAQAAAAYLSRVYARVSA
mmetsp:Transcript_112127/g.362036  ORF Transcript_112127/g.362036 Transcript_112127/m.362036 type:complete len:265 (+) Transcript_112127:83-877(+)